MPSTWSCAILGCLGRRPQVFPSHRMEVDLIRFNEAPRVRFAYPSYIAFHRAEPAPLLFRGHWLRGETNGLESSYDLLS